MSLYDIFPVKEVSGDIVTFEDGADGIPMESISAVITPTQDLHGYANPWPAGGGKNKFLTTLETDTKNQVTATVDSDGFIHLSGTASATTIFALGSFTFSAGEYYITMCPPGGSTTTYRVYASWGSNDTGNGWTRTFTEGEERNFQLNISSGTNVDGLVLKPMICFASQGTDFAPYENICPISGLTGLSVYRAGTNLFDPDSLETVTVNVGERFGHKYSGVGTYAIKAYATGTSGYVYARVLNTDGTWGSVYYVVANTTATAQTITISAGQTLFIYNASAWTESASSELFNGWKVQVVLSSTQPDSYKPYNGNTYAVDWTTQAGTVYHGTVNLVTGQLTVDRVSANLNYATKSETANGYFWYTTAGELSIGAISGLNAGLISDRLVATGNVTATSPEGEIAFYANGIIRWKEQGSLSQADYRTYIASNPIQIVYELATPITYQLTPQEVATLLGLNNVWATVAPITVKYHAQDQTENVRIDSLFVDGVDMQADGWFLKWRKLAAPKPKTDYISVWGRDGDIDLTENESDGQVFYENRELTMDMVYIGDDWTQAYSDLLDKLHGKDCMVQFTSDPYWYWAGRVVASLFEHKPHSLTMNGIMFPYKLSIGKTTASATVSGATEETATEVVLHGSRMRVSPKVTVTGESVTLKWGNKTQTLSAGTYYVRGLKVGSNDVTIKVWGTGTVDFEYRKGML